MKERSTYASLLVILLASFVLLAIPPSTYADLYQWTDKDGVLHITDDMGKVPEDIRWKVKTFKTTPPKEVEPYRPVEEVVPEEKRDELYGDEPLEWWLNTFRKMNQDIQAIEGRIAARKQYMDIFEGGRRFGQTYAAEDVERYEKFKKEMPEDKKELEELEEELMELRRKATIHGVPREIRGE
jgi:hypothetical protein